MGGVGGWCSRVVLVGGVDGRCWRVLMGKALFVVDRRGNGPDSLRLHFPMFSSSHWQGTLCRDPDEAGHLAAAAFD